MNKPIVGVTLFFIIGLITGRYLPFSIISLLYLILLCFLGLGILLYLKNRKKSLNFLLISLWGIIGALYFNYSYFPRSLTPILNLVSEEVEIEGRVATRPELKGKVVNFILEAKKMKKVGYQNKEEEKKVEGRIWISSFSLFRNYDYADLVRVRGRLKRPQNLRENFDWQKYLSYRRVWVEMRVNEVELIRKEKGFLLIEWAYKNKDWMVRVINFILPETHSALLKGIMLGDKKSLPANIQENFLKTGTGHILVVSGLHVGLILFLFLTLFKVLSFPPKLAHILSIPLLGYYAFLTGLRIPVLRATLMAIIVLLSFILDRESPPLIIFSLSCLIILLFDPLSLFTISFQLSFITVGGIIYLLPHIEKRLNRLPFLLRRPLAISLAAQFSVLSLLAFYFNRLPLIGVVSNIIISPLITIILALGLLSLIMSLLTLGGAQIIGFANWVFLTLLLKITHLFTFPQNEFMQGLTCPYIKPFPFWVLLIYYFCLITVPHLPDLKELLYNRGIMFRNEYLKNFIKSGKGEKL